jgi:hypothetical protein
MQGQSPAPEFLRAMMSEFRDHDDAGDLVLKCAACGEEIEPGTVESCEYCKASTHGDLCLADHLEICEKAGALPPKMPARNEPRRVRQPQPRKRYS